MLLLKTKANVEKYKTNIHTCLPKFCSSRLLWPTTVLYLYQTVCLRKLGHFILHSKCSKNISNSEWVFYSTSWGLNKGVWDLTYPLTDSLAWPKCLPVLQYLGNTVTLNTASSDRPRKQGAPLGEAEPQVSWAEAEKAIPRYVHKKGYCGPNTCSASLESRSHSLQSIPLTLISAVSSTWS